MTNTTSIFARQMRFPTRGPSNITLDDLGELSALSQEHSQPLINIASASPYLFHLMKQEAQWLLRAHLNPEHAFGETLKSAKDVPLKDLAAHLRTSKRRVALLVGLCDLMGVWPLEDVTQRLTDFADHAVNASLRALLDAELKRGKLPQMSAADLDSFCGLSVLAMGKMGAGELNYSSDIDIICLFDETRFAPEDYGEARASFIRVTRKMTAMLSDITAQGYVFRTDLRLRPDASSTPVCLSMEAAERYYESLGRTWERAAYIKARPCAGDLKAGTRFLEGLRPFIWRKHLDFAAIQDAHDMRLKIRGHKKLYASAAQAAQNPDALSGYHMKLGQGGIREIEFFTQTRQLIAGGRDASLRQRSTKDGLSALTVANWITPETRDTLYEHYRYYRDIEHRVQMIEDQQTHELPTHDDGFARLAALMGDELGTLKNTIAQRLLDAHKIIEHFFAPETNEDTQTNAFNSSSSTKEGTTGDAHWDEKILERWQTYPALRSSRARDIFKRLRPQLLSLLHASARPNEALLHFDTFLSGLPAGVQVFSLFEANPALTRLIVDICSTAPALANYLSKNTSIFDAVIAGDFFAPWPNLKTLKADLDHQISLTDDYETVLNIARRWMKEWHFRIGVHYLRSLTDALDARAQYAQLAQVTIEALWPFVAEEFARKYGRQPGQGALILGMGSLGAKLLHSQSDLDMIVLYDAQGDTSSSGPKSLSTQVYYARLTQALLAALNAPMADGTLYEVDMRLRPSGRQGPLAVSKDSFFEYQENDAWTWEYLALTRARYIAGSQALSDEVMAFRSAFLKKPHNANILLNDLKAMREKITSSKTNTSPWDAKYGKGRLQDCELFIQTLALLCGCDEQSPLAQLSAAVQASLIGESEGKKLLKSLTLFLKLQTAARLLTGDCFDPQMLGENGLRFVLYGLKQPSIEGLKNEIDVCASFADDLISKRLSQPSITRTAT